MSTIVAEHIVDPSPCKRFQKGTESTAPQPDDDGDDDDNPDDHDDADDNCDDHDDADDNRDDYEDKYHDEATWYMVCPP